MSDEQPPKTGADLARDALAAARARNAERRAQAGQATPVRRARGTAGLSRRRWSGPGPDGRDPAPLGAALTGWVKRAGAGADLVRATVFGRWPELVGPGIAEHAQPVSLVDGDLLLQAESTAWATQIRLLAPQLQRTLNTQLGAGAIKRIRAQGPTGPSWRFGPRHVSGRGPRDTYG